MLKRISAVMIGLFVMMLVGCTGTTIGVPGLDSALQTLVAEKAIEKRETPVVYSCYGGTQSLNDWKPVKGTFGLWMDTVLVVDEGYMFTVDTPTKGGVFESANLYSTVKDYVDVGISEQNLTRYYRINQPSLMFVRSTVNAGGDGTATIIFNCSTDRAKIADPASVRVVE